VPDAREDAGAAAAQGVRVDPGPFERLPGDLQQQALLRVHRGRLARGDAEERRVEVRHVRQEATDRRVGGVGGPAAVGREGAQYVQAPRHQFPQGFRRVRPARVAAAHRDDRHGLVVGGAAGPVRFLVLAVRGQLGGEVPGQVVGCGVREDEPGAQREPGGGGQRAAELDGRHRVQAQLAESQPGVDIARRVMAEHRRQAAAHQVQRVGGPRGPNPGGLLLLRDTLRVVGRGGQGGACGRNGPHRWNGAGGRAGRAVGQPVATPLEGVGRQIDGGARHDT